MEFCRNSIHAEKGHLCKCHVSSLCCTRAPQIILQRARLEHQCCLLQKNPVYGSGRLKLHLITTTTTNKTAEDSKQTSCFGFWVVVLGCCFGFVFVCTPDWTFWTRFCLQCFVPLPSAVFSYAQLISLRNEYFFGDTFDVLCFHMYKLQAYFENIWRKSRTKCVFRR